MNDVRSPVRARGARCAVLACCLIPWQEPAPDKLCGDCKTTGRLAFELPKEVVRLEGRARHCSEVVEDAGLNHGLDFRPCARCRAPGLKAGVEEEWRRRRDEELAWLAERRGIDQFLDDRRLDLMHVSTPHFELAWSVPKVKVGQKVYDQHAAMHLYAERLEDAYADYLGRFGLHHESSQNNVRHTIMCFEMQRHSTKAQPKYTGIGGSGVSSGTKLMGSTSVFVCYWDKTRNPDDEHFHDYLLHNVVHLFLAAEGNYAWLGREYGWVDEGFSHWVTERLFGRARTHCYQEQDELAGWVTDDWRPEVRRRVTDDRIPAFADVLGKHEETLTAVQHLFCWSWVEFLVEAHDPALFVQFVNRLKARAEVRDALKEVYGLTVLEFLERWRRHVLDTYPSH